MSSFRKPLQGGTTLLGVPQGAFWARVRLESEVKEGRGGPRDERRPRAVPAGAEQSLLSLDRLAPALPPVMG